MTSEDIIGLLNQRAKLECYEDMTHVHHHLLPMTIANAVVAARIGKILCRVEKTQVDGWIIYMMAQYEGVDDSQWYLVEVPKEFYDDEGDTRYDRLLNRFIPADTCEGSAPK